MEVVTTGPIRAVLNMKMEEVTPSLPVASWGGVDTVSGEITPTRNAFHFYGFTAFLSQCFSPGTDELCCNWIHLWHNKDPVLSLEAVEWSWAFYSTAGLLISGNFFIHGTSFLVSPEHDSVPSPVPVTLKTNLPHRIWDKQQHSCIHKTWSSPSLLCLKWGDPVLWKTRLFLSDWNSRLYSACLHVAVE